MPGIPPLPSLGAGEPPLTAASTCNGTRLLRLVRELKLQLDQLQALTHLLEGLQHAVRDAVVGPRLLNDLQSCKGRGDV